MFEMYALNRSDCFVYWLIELINGEWIPYMWIESSGKYGLSHHDSMNLKIGKSIRSDPRWEKIA